MRLHTIPSTLLSLLFAISSGPIQTSAISIPILDELMPDLSLNQLSPRDCANPCGYYGQVCCSAGQYCFTDSANQAQCGSSPPQTTASAAPAQSGGSWQMFTTTYVQTDLSTITSTYSSLISSAPTTNQGSQSSGVACKYSLGETECGSVCCSAGQFCLASGQCASNGGGGSSGAFSTLHTVTTTANTGSAPLRPTSGTVVTVTSTGSATTTVPYQTPVGTDGGSLVGAQPSTSGGGLSGGAIAGIVIGVLIGIALLIALCVCCLLKGCLDGLLGLLGLRNNRRRREETTYIEERRSHHHHGGSAYAAADRRSGGRTWFGTRPSRVTERKTEKKTGGVGGLAGVAAGLGTLGLILGLKRRSDRKKHDAKSETTGYGSSYYSDEYTTSASK